MTMGPRIAGSLGKLGDRVGAGTAIVLIVTMVCLIIAELFLSIVRATL
jgi:hypothetical protein